MQSGRKIIQIFLLIIWWTQPSIAATISGSVRTNDGTPLANVKIYMDSDAVESKTNADGTFVIKTELKNPVIFVAHPGFRPAAKVIRSVDERADIVLEPESLSTWWLPICLSEHPKGKIVEHMGVPRLLLPKGVKYRTGPTDIDVRVDYITFGKFWNTQQLEFWLGFSASGPRPPSYLFEESKEFTLRFWRIKGMSEKYFGEGVDARGIDMKNRHWRHVNIGSNGIMYRQASDAAAKFFDEIIDSLCIPTTAKVQ